MRSWTGPPTGARTWAQRRNRPRRLHERGTMSTTQYPASVTWATRLLVALVALGAVVTLLIVVLQDQLIRTWAEGRSDTRKVLRTRGLEAVKNGEVHVPQFIPVALTLFVVVA